MDRSNFSFKQVLEALNFKQDYLGLLVGMPKQSISRLVRGYRKETLMHKETLALIMFLKEKGMLRDYIKWRFDLSISRNFYKKQ